MINDDYIKETFNGKLGLEEQFLKDNYNKEVKLLYILKGGLDEKNERFKNIVSLIIIIITIL